MNKFYKRVLTCLAFSISFSFTNGQWVTIPDANFVYFLNQNFPGCMNGNQMDTTCSGIVNATTVSCGNKGIANLSGIRYFDNLLSLSCSYNSLSSLPVLPDSLKYLNCSSNPLTSLSTLPPTLSQLSCIGNQLTFLPPLPSSLYFLECQDNLLTSLPALSSNLHIIYCQNNQLTSLPALPSSLSYLKCSNNQLTSLPALPSPFSYLDCTYNQLTSLPVLPSSMTGLHCNNNQLTSLPALPSSLQSIACHYNQLTSLPALPSSLTNFSCNNNQITSLPALSNVLTYLECNDNLISFLPSLPSSLTYINCWGNQLTTLPTLPSSLSYLDCSNNQLTSLPALPSSLLYLYCQNNSLSFLPSLPSSLIKLYCYGISNHITCLPTLPASLQVLAGAGAGYSCLPNKPASLTTIFGPSTICSQNQAVVTPAGPVIFCTGGSVTLNANTATGLTYQWMQNGVNIAGASSSSYVANVSGNYTVLETSSTGCVGTESAAVVVTVNAQPSATITPNGNLNFCTGPGITLQANTGTGLTYLWRKNNINIAGATNSFYLANTNGTFTVVVTNNLSCSVTSTGVSVTTPPSVTISVNGPTHFCTGGNVTLTATSGQTVAYKWKKNGAFISGATNSSYLATSSGSYNCVVTNSFGCSKGGTPLAVTGPPSAVITANGPTTFCAGGSVQLSAASGYTYQWIKNSGNISGATQQNYTATTAGNYKVKVTDAFGCSKTTPSTNQITVNVPCREGNFTNETNQGLTIYPNPSSGVFEMMIPSVENKSTEIEIYSPDGRLIKKQAVETNNPFYIDLTQQADGIYFIHILFDGQLINKKVVKQ